MNMLLEHVDNPINVLQTCKNHLSTNGVIIAQVPNSTSVTRKIGVLMGIIESTGHMSEKEINFFGHQRVYTLDSLSNDCTNAGLKILESGGILYKPLPNTDLYKLCKSKGENWTNKFLQALVDYGKDKATDCANIYIVCN